MQFKARHIISFGVLVLITMVGIWQFKNSDYDIVNYPSSGKNVIAFGDSLTEGVGAEEGEDFVTQLSQEIGIPVINAGTSGDTTQDALDRLENDVLDKNPNVVLVLLGGNDYLLRIPKEETFNNLGTIIDQIHEKGGVVLLLGVKGGLFKDFYEEDFEKLAREKGAAYISNVLDGVLGNSGLMADQIHPNSKGYKEIASRIAPVLESLLR